MLSSQVLSRKITTNKHNFLNFLPYVLVGINNANCSQISGNSLFLSDKIQLDMWQMHSTLGIRGLILFHPLAPSFPSIQRSCARFAASVRWGKREHQGSHETGIWGDDYDQIGKCGVMFLLYSHSIGQDSVIWLQLQRMLENIATLCALKEEEVVWQISSQSLPCFNHHYHHHQHHIIIIIIQEIKK